MTSLKTIPIKIVSDGTVHGTKIIHAETGELLAGVIAVEWRIEVGAEFPVAWISVREVPVEIITAEGSVIILS